MPSNCEVSQPLLFYRVQMSSITICSAGNGGTEGVKRNSTGNGARDRGKEEERE